MAVITPVLRTGKLRHRHIQCLSFPDAPKDTQSVVSTWRSHPSDISLLVTEPPKGHPQAEPGGIFPGCASVGPTPVCGLGMSHRPSSWTQGQNPRIAEKMEKISKVTKSCHQPRAPSATSLDTSRGGDSTRRSNQMGSDSSTSNPSPHLSFPLFRHPEPFTPRIFPLVALAHPRLSPVSQCPCATVGRAVSPCPCFTIYSLAVGGSLPRIPTYSIKRRLCSLRTMRL